MRSLKNYIAFPAARPLLLLLAALTVVFIVFQAGTYFGYQRSHFMAYRGIPPVGPFGILGMVPHFELGGEGHGTIGAISSVSLPRVTIISRDGAERAVLIGSTTAIRAGSGATSSSALVPKVMIVVIGNPDDDGDIDAKLVRILPPPPDAPQNPAPFTK